MGEFLGQLLGGIPTDAYGVYLALALLTAALVRCSLHPTVFALVAWPGTTCHEASHLLVGVLLGAKPTSLSLWPRALGNGSWQLGAVEFTSLKWWNAPWTAMAPLLLAPLSLTLTLTWVYPSWATGDFTSAAIALYVCATILQAAWPSVQDFEVAFPGLVVIGAIIAWLW